MRAPPAKYNLARPLSSAAQIGIFAQMPPTALFYTAGETPRAPRAPSLVVICDLVLMQCLLGSRPCGRLLPSTTWRAHERRCLDGHICPNAAYGTFLHGGRDATRSQGTELSESMVVGIGMVLMGNAHAGVSCRVQVGAPMSSAA